MSFLINLFLPRQTNNHKAHAIKTHFLLGLSVLFVLLQATMNFTLANNPDVLGYSANISPEKIVELTNSERSKLGLGALTINSLLNEAARQKAGDMFAFNYWAHVSPSGRTPWSFFSDAGYKYQYAGENLARDFKDPGSVVVAWMNSPSHRENIVNSKYKEIGVAVVDGKLQGSETTLVVQLFGTSYGSAPNKVADKPKTETIPVKEVMPIEEPVEIPVEEQVVPTVAAEPVENPAVQPIFSTREILSKSTGKELPFTSPLDLTKAITIFIVGILIGVFGADLVMVSHHHTPRFSSRSFAQMVFLFFILGATLLVKQGAIL